MNSSLFILIGRNPVAIDIGQALEWGKWMEANMSMGTRRVARTVIESRKPLRKGGKMLTKVNRKRAKSVMISTVFLGLDHNWLGSEPITFESMIFGGKHDQEMRRYQTIEQAQQGHKELVAITATGVPKQYIKHD